MARGVHTVHVVIGDDEWRAFRARCMAAGVQLRDRLAQLVQLDLAGKAGAIAAAPGPLAELPPASSSRKPPARRRRASTKPPAARKGATKAPGKRRRSVGKLPTVSDADVAREAAAGARAARKRK